MGTKTIPNRYFRNYIAGTQVSLVMVNDRVDGCFKSKVSAVKMAKALMLIPNVCVVEAIVDHMGDFVIDI